MPCRCLGRSNSYCEVFPCRLPEEKSAACYPHGCRSRSKYRHFAAPGEPLPSATFEFGKLPVEESTLPPNGFPHAPHHHAHSEIWLIREGTLQLTINATPPVLGPGGLGFVRSNEEHGIFGMWKRRRPITMLLRSVRARIRKPDSAFVRRRSLPRRYGDAQWFSSECFGAGSSYFLYFFSPGDGGPSRGGRPAVRGRKLRTRTRARSSGLEAGRKK